MIDLNPESLLVQLRERKGQWPSVAERTGVSYSWITKFAQGRIPNPGVATLRKLAAGLRNA